MCIGGSTRVPDVHRRVKIRYGADPRAVHDREPDVDRHHPCSVLLQSMWLCARGWVLSLLEREQGDNRNQRHHTKGVDPSEY